MRKSKPKVEAEPPQLRIDSGLFRDLKPPSRPAHRGRRDADVAKDILRIRKQRLAVRIRELEQEPIRTFEPLPVGQRFMASNAIVRLADGSNQAGKTLMTLMEVVRAFTGTDPLGKYPKQDCRILIVGFDLDHIADPIWRKLTRRGEFSLIRDRQTGNYRSVRPDPSNPKALDPDDLARKSEWVDSPPLLPQRFIRRIAFQDAGKGIPRVVEGVNGSRILFRSSKGPVSQGFQGHLIVFDEEIDKAEQWWNESVPRLMAEEGRFIWSATPLAGGLQLYDLREKADAGIGWAERFTFLLDDNPYISEERKQIFKESILDDIEARARIYGEYIVLARRVYPTYDPMGKHGCEPFEIPAHWSRYLVLDPATTYCATLFAAVDPDENHVWVYGGMVLSGGQSGLSADTWADEVKRRSGSVAFEAFIIDQHMGRQHPPGAGKNTAEQYFEAAMRADLRPRSIGPSPFGGFWPGSDDLSAREQALMRWMALRGTGPRINEPVLKVMRGVFPELDQQIRFARVNQRGKRVNESDANRMDALDCLEYLAAHHPRYRRPPENLVGIDPEVVRRFKEKSRRQTREANGQRLGKFLTLGGR